MVFAWTARRQTRIAKARREPHKPANLIQIYQLLHYQNTSSSLVGCIYILNAPGDELAVPGGAYEGSVSNARQATYNGVHEHWGPCLSLSLPDMAFVGMRASRGLDIADIVGTGVEAHG